MTKKLIPFLIITLLFFNFNLFAQEDNYKYTVEDIGDDFIEALDNGEDTIESFRSGFLKYLKADANIEMFSEEMIDLLNKHLSILTMESYMSKKVREKASLFKFAIDLRYYKIISDIVYPLSCQGINGKKLDINLYEIIDGEKETLLDYVEKILTKTRKLCCL